MSMNWIYDGEAWVYGFIPFVLALAILGVSVRIAWKTKSLGHTILSIPIVVGSGLVAYVLFETLVRNGWPSYVPHIILGVCLLLVIAQMLLYREASTA